LFFAGGIFWLNPPRGKILPKGKRALSFVKKKAQ